ncbi:MAG: sigma-70 family RNA polymerase sigma factor [Planctomycetota bacterium]
MGDVTRIIQDIRDGDDHAADRLLIAVYAELRRLAARKVANERPGQTLQPTALVHEAYLRLLGDDQAAWENRGHFFCAAAEAMRRILVEAARRKARLKHGGGRQRVPVNEADVLVDAATIDLIALNEALDRLAKEDPQKAELVKLRYYAGLKVEEAAVVLDISRATADRYWSYARAWLFDAIGGD